MTATRTPIRPKCAFPWTDAAIQQLCEMRAAGKSLLAIAAAIGCSDDVVTRKVRALQLPLESKMGKKSTWSEGDLARLRRLVEHGQSLPDIAAAFGKRLASVRSAVRRHKMRPAPARPNTRPKGGARKPTPSAPAILTVPARSERPVARREYPAEAPRRYAAEALLTLPRGGCKSPIGDPRSPDFRFCGAGAVEGKSYCASCAQVAYQALPGRRISHTTVTPDKARPNSAVT